MSSILRRRRISRRRHLYFHEVQKGTIMNALKELKPLLSLSNLISFGESSNQLADIIKKYLDEYNNGYHVDVKECTLGILTPSGDIEYFTTTDVSGIKLDISKRNENDELPVISITVSNREIWGHNCEAYENTDTYKRFLADGYNGFTRLDISATCDPNKGEYTYNNNSYSVYLKNNRRVVNEELDIFIDYIRRLGYRYIPRVTVESLTLAFDDTQIVKIDLNALFA